MITLKPGLLVSLKTSLTGGVTYQREDLEKSGGGIDGDAKVEKWKTTKVITDPVEYERAVKVRSKLGSMIRAVCVPSAFGLLCPVAKEAALNQAIKDSREMATVANQGFNLSRVAVFAMIGRIAESDAEASRAVASELRDLFDEMKDGIAKANVEQIRAAAVKAKAMGKMLDNGAAGKVTAAIAEARDTATEIMKRLGKGEVVAAFVQDVKLKALDEARATFLEIDDGESAPVAPIAATPMPQVAIDLDDESEPDPEREGQDRYIREQESNDDAENVDRKAATS